MSDEYYVRSRGAPEAGPMAAPIVRRMVRAGELGSEDLIRRDGSARWLKIGSVPQLAAELPKPPPDELGLGDATAASRAGNPANVDADGSARHGLKRADTTMLLVLSILTFGIYGMLWFLGVSKSYRGISGRSEPNLEALFWVYFGCTLCGWLLVWTGFGLLLLLGGAVVGAILLSNVLKDRAKVALQAGGVKGLSDRSMLIGFWVVGEIIPVIGLPFALWQAYLFATDHNKIVKACAISRPELLVQGGEDD